MSKTVDEAIAAVMKIRRGPRKPLADRFWSKVDRTGECWTWTAAKFTGGYGKFMLNDKTIGAHRVAYEIANGPVNGMHVLHKCDNRLCVKPDHLFLGTNRDNMEDKVSKGRAQRMSGEANGSHKLTNKQVIAIRQDTRKNTAIAKEHNVTDVLIGMIKRGQAWSHLL